MRCDKNFSFERAIKGVLNNDWRGAECEKDIMRGAESKRREWRGFLMKVEDMEILSIAGTIDDENDEDLQ